MKASNEQVKGLIEAYLRQRNYSSSRQHPSTCELEIDVGQMSYVESITAIESTIYDYYVYTTGSPMPPVDYLKQYSA
jgi:hypothetical protein